MGYNDILFSKAFHVAQKIILNIFVVENDFLDRFAFSQVASK